MTETILIIVGLTLFILLAAKKIKFSLVIINILLATYLIRFNIFNIPFTFLEMTILALTAVWLVKVILKKEKIYLSSYFSIILLFLLVGIVSVFISPDIKAALGIYKAYFIEPALYFLVFINVIKERKDIKLIVFSFGAAALVISLIAVWQYLNIFPGLEPYISETPKRATSLFEFPTAVGKFLGPIICLFLALIFVGKEKIKTNWRYLTYLWGVIIFSLLATIFSFTRAALLGILAAFILIRFFSRYKKIIWFSLLVIILIFMAIPWSREQIFSVVSGSDTSTDVHVIMWQGTWKMLKAHPITGAGLAGFPEVYNLYRDAAHTELFPYPDNFFLAVWAELGLAGVALFCWLIIKFLKEAANTFKKSFER